MKSLKFEVQSSNKVQIVNFKLRALIFGFSLMFDFWFLNFATGEGL